MWFMVKTWLTDRFGLDVPVVSAPMAGVSGGALAAAVSEAGGLGMVGVAAMTPEALRTELDLAAKPGRPFGVGFLAWLLPRTEELLDIALGARPALISVSLGPYQKFLDRVRDAGIVTVTQAGTLDDAKRARDDGVDVIVVRGSEGGGHGRNEVATLPLLQMVLDEIGDERPVLAAGGIATGRGLAAVLAAGAQGAWVGSAFVASTESLWPQPSKDAVVAAGETDTMYSTVFDIGRGIPWPSEFGGRALRNEYATRWHGREAELANDPVTMEETAVWVGQVAGLITGTRSAKDIVTEMAAQAGALLAEVCSRATRG